MPSRLYRPPPPGKEPSASELLEDHPHTISKESLVERIVAKSQAAVKVNRVRAAFYQRLRAGRRCSCFEASEEAQNQCIVCIGTGVVGGYEKYGCRTEILDVTRPDIIAVNVKPAYKDQTHPVRFKLLDGAKYGYVETKIRIRPNTGVADAAQFIASIKHPGTNATAWVKSPSAPIWDALTKENFQARLASTEMQLRIVLERNDIDTPSPTANVVRVRYQLLEDVLINVDIPRSPNSFSLGDLGVFEEFQTLTFFLDNTLQDVNSNDFFQLERDQRRWKAIEVNDNTPFGVRTSWFITVRRIQGSEGINALP